MDAETFHETRWQVSGNRVCWDRAAIQFATQVDVGGLEVDDPRADAVFGAIHQALPVRRVRDVGGGRTSGASDLDVLKVFTKEIDSNEPLLLFVTGAKGTGKSHLVRWLKSRIGTHPEWHVVYVEKRNTSLRRVTERILNGIDTPKAVLLRESLAQASSMISSDEEAMSALLARLDRLVTYDSATEITSLPDVSSAELADLRRKASRLLGDFTFRAELSRKLGPVHRIVRLARGGAEPSEDVDEADLHLTDADLVVDPSRFEDLGHEMQRLVGSLVSSKPMRTDIAKLCDWYLPRAKAEVFTGQGTDLLDVFEDVRREIASRGQELCLFIEDLVLLHGIDKQLAQALTIPASADLCNLRAAIAVTSGYLSSLDTFTDRGVQFTLDIDMEAIGSRRLRDFVGRYLNVGRLSSEALIASRGTGRGSTIPNGCLDCPDRVPCHETFGTSELGHGLYPFNGAAVDRLVELASPGGFRPREILRQVIRAPLETAEEELPTSGTFPSRDFAHALDENRQNVPVAVRTSVRRDNVVNPDAELSLRAFYAQSPVEVDSNLERVAQYFGVTLTPEILAGQGEVDEKQEEKDTSAGPRQPAVDEVERWANGEMLTAPTALSIRKWICDAVIAKLQNGAYGVAIRKPRRNEWQVGSYVMRVTDVVIDRAMGSSALTPSAELRIERTDENAILMRGILEVVRGGVLDSVDGGAWFFRLQTKISQFADAVAGLATDDAMASLSGAVQALAVLRNGASDPGATVRDALPAMLISTPPAHSNRTLLDFLREVRPFRDEALTIVRDRATMAKGSGKPSLLDVGPSYQLIRSRLKTRSLEGDIDTDDGVGRVFRGIKTKQSRAAATAWSDVTRAVQNVNRFLDPEEDLPAALKIVDRLVSDAHTKGMLPRADSRTEYEEAREKVEPEMMEVYRRFSGKVIGNVGPDDLWDVLADPLPQLWVLGRYAAVTSELLSSLEATLTETTDGKGFADTEALIKEFRGLADLLDIVASQGGR
jgi:hypothetical protein